MTLGKIDRRTTSLAGVVYLKLREAIVNGQISPGDALVEEQLAASLGVSRAPLREALAKLEHEGLLESIPYRGSIVSTISRSEVIQAMQVREPLEMLAMHLAIELIPIEEIERVIQFITERRPLLLRGDVIAHFECNREVHGLAPRHSGNVFLVEFLRQLEEKTHVYRLGRQNPDGEIASMADEHLAILEAYRRRDLEGAQAAMRRHIYLTCKRLGGGVACEERGRESPPCAETPEELETLKRS